MKDELKEPRIEDKDFKKYKKDVTLKEHNTYIGSKFGTYKIDEHLEKQAFLAMTQRLEDTKNYTQTRIDRINANYKLVETRESTRDDSDTKITDCQIFSAVEDWKDDLYMIFKDYPDIIKLNDENNLLDGYIVRMAEIDSTDDDKNTGLLREMFNAKKIQGMTQEDKEFLELLSQSPETKGLSDQYEAFLSGENVTNKESFYFNRMEVVKTFLMMKIAKSEYEKELMEFISHGVISGTYCFEMVWGKINKKRIIQNSDDDFQFKLVSEYGIKFEPVDTRMLIHKKTSRDWVIKKKQTTFSEILGEITDDDGAFLTDTIYDIDQLKKIQLELQRNQSNINLLPKEIDEDEEQEDSDSGIDGEIELLIGYDIPIKQKVKNGKITKSMVVNSIVTMAIVNDKKIVIGVRDADLFISMPLKFGNHEKKNGDVQGIGLPERLEPLARAVDTILGYSMDALYVSIFGILLIDEDKLKDPDDVITLSPKKPIFLKNTEGLPLSSVMQWFNGNINASIQGFNAVDMLTNKIKTLSRKGPSGEKIAPNPSATEAFSIITESEKSVTVAALEINLMLKDFVEELYIYSVTKTVDNQLELKVNATRVIDSVKELGVKEISRTKPKKMLFSKKDLLIDGLEFEITAIEKANKNSIKKQQNLQLFNLLAPTYYTEHQQPDGSMKKKTLIDDSGNEVMLNETQHLKNILKDHDMIKMFIPAKIKEATLPLTPQTPPGAANDGMSTDEPNLSASTDQSALLAGVANAV